MSSLTETICMKRWHAYVLLGTSGFAVGTVLARITEAMGF